MGSLFLLSCQLRTRKKTVNTMQCFLHTLLSVKILTNIARSFLAKCSLTCRKGRDAYPQGRDVKDGTRCVRDPTIRDVCIQGKCRVR